MPTTTVPTKFNDRRLAVVDYMTNSEMLELNIKNLNSGHIELAWIPEEGARVLVAALVEKFGQGILPKPKTQTEITMESFAKLAIGDRFEATHPARVKRGGLPMLGTKVGEDLIEWESGLGMLGNKPSVLVMYAWTFTKVEKPSVQRTILEDNTADFAAIPVGAYFTATTVADPRNLNELHFGGVDRYLKVSDTTYIFAASTREYELPISGHNLWRREYAFESKRESLDRQFAELPVGPFTFVAIKRDGSDSSRWPGYVKLDDNQVYTPLHGGEVSTIDQLGGLAYYRLESVAD